MPTTLTDAHLARDLAIRDLTDPAEGHHAIQALVDAAQHALGGRWRCAIRDGRGPRVVPLTDNYDDLRYPTEAVTRDARYSRYVDDTHMLRSHSTAMVPSALRALAAEPSPPDDVLLVCPGITYRRDAIDRLHSGTPHQLDLWRVTRRAMTAADLDEMIRVLLADLVPGLRYRTEPRVHPYTLDGRQVDVLAGGEWVEVWECGLAHPGVLRGCGLDDGWSGLALGMGLDRLLMLRKGIPDIRLLRSADTRVAEQLHDLAPYHAVSNLPAMKRDLSIAVDSDDDAELLGDRVRDALGDEADLVETIEIQTETPYVHLPVAAIERLGMSAAQKNVLVRLVIRPHERTLTDAEANDVRDRVYAALHRGSMHQWS